MVEAGGRAGTGAVLSLSAIGKQDTYLDTTNQEKSFFNYKTIQSTNSSLFYNPHIIYNREPNNAANNWPFGKRIVFPINPLTSGDILADAYIKCKLPKLNTGNYSPIVGQNLIQKIEFNIDGQTIDTITGDWLVIHSQLFITKISADKRQGAYFYGPKTPVKDEINLLIPLNLFFCRDTPYVYNQKKSIADDTLRSYFFLCSCWANKGIEIVITFNDIEFFTEKTTIPDEVYLSNVNLVTQEFTLSPEERDYYKRTELTIPYTIVSRQPVETIPAGQLTSKIFFNVPSPVKSFHWFLRSSNVQTEREFYNQRFNFSGWQFPMDPPTPDKSDSNPIMETATFYLNNQTEQIGFKADSDSTGSKTGHIYFKYLQSFQHNLSAPLKNIYSYSFCLDPKNPRPTGSVNLSTLPNSNTFLSLNITDKWAAYSTLDPIALRVDVHVYFLLSTVLQYKDGFCSSVFN